MLVLVLLFFLLCERFLETLATKNYDFYSTTKKTVFNYKYNSIRISRIFASRSHEADWYIPTGPIPTEGPVG